MIARPENNPRHYFITVGILLIFTILFMVLFRVEAPPKKDDDQSSSHNLFQMIPHASVKDPNTLKQVKEDKLNIGEMTARDELDDPTIMSFPNEKYGFSTVLKIQNEPPKPAIEKYVLPVMNVDAPLIDRTPLVGIFPEPNSSDPGILSAPILSAIAIPKVNKEVSARIVWLENNIEKSTPLKLEEALKAAAGKVPSSRTEVKIEKLSTSPALFLVQKSGVPALDDLVMKHLRARLLKVFVGEISAQALPDSIIVDWRLVLRGNKNP